MNTFLVYCEDNKNVADNLDQNLSRAGIQLQHYQRRVRDGREEEYRMFNSQPSTPILLLVSGNFLRSKDAMFEALNFLQNPSLKSRIVPIITDDRIVHPSTGEVNYADTRFERVKDLYHHMNHWQDIYLEMRRMRRHDLVEDEDMFERDLNVVRGISSEIGEFLRILQGRDYFHYQDLLNSKFEPLFRRNRWDTLFLKFRSMDMIPLPKEEKVLVAAGGVEPTPIILENTPPVEDPVSVIEPSGKVPSELTKIVEEKVDIPNEDRVELRSKLSEYKKDLEEINEEKTAPIINKQPLEAVIKETVKEIEEEEEDVELESLFDEDEERGEVIILESSINKDIGEPHVIITPDEDDEEEDEDDEEIIITKETIEKFAAELDEEQIPHDLEGIKAVLEGGDPDNALRMLEETLADNPDNHAARALYMGVLVDNGKNYAAARKQMDILLEAHPESVELLMRAAELAEKTDNHIRARRHYEEALELDDEYPGLHFRLANLLNKHFRTKKKQAAKHYKEAAKQDPDNVGALYQQAIIMHEYLGKPKKALKLFQQVMQKDPAHPFAHYDVAVLFYEMEKPQLAARHYYEACQINPELRTDRNDEAFRVEEFVLIPMREEEERRRAEEEARKKAEEEARIKAEEEARQKAEEEERIRQEEEAKRQAEEEERQRLEEEARLKEEQEHKDIVIKEMSLDNNALDNGAYELSALPETPEVPVPDTTTKAFITGATAGIGRATAELFAKQGYHLVITGRRGDRLQALKQQLEQAYGIQVEALTFDVRDADACQQAISSLPPQFRNVDILINNAGLAKGREPIHKGSLEHWETMIDTNIKGLLYMTRLIAPGMVARGGGHIINVSSSAGKDVYPNGNVYCATKHAVDALTKAMRLDLHQHNIRVSAVSPGAVEETEFSLVRYEGDEERAAKVYENYQPLRASDVAEIIHFIASRPPHVNIQDVIAFSTQQASVHHTHRSGR